jgi:RNA polymerase sigma factor (sigma-70 family)
MATASMSTFLRRLTRGMAAETLQDQSDRQLVERLLAGRDEAVFEAIVRRHGPMVYRVCWRVLQQEQDTEDAFQATFLILAQQLRTVRRPASLASWLHGIARRVALKARAQGATRHRHEQEAATANFPPEEVPWRELRAVLDAELERLPEKWRLPLILCYLEGQTQDQAAQQLGWSERTLQRRLAEARAALGRRLTGRGVVWPAALSAVLLCDCVAPAALAPRLLRSTVEAAAFIAAGKAAPVAAVSANVAALTEGVLKTMFTSKLKTATAALVLLAALAVGASGLLYQTQAAEPQPPAKAEKPAAQQGAEPMPVVVRDDAQVTQAAWSADGDVVATVGITFEVREGKGKNGPVKSHMANSTVKLWDAKTGALKKSLGEEKETNIQAIALSPDKKRAAIAGSHIGGGGDFVRILDSETWVVKQELDEVPGVDHLAFSPDGKTLAMGGNNCFAKNGSFVKLWDVQKEKLRGGTKFAEELPAPGAELGEWHVQCLAFSPDSKLLAVGEWGERSKHAKIQLYDAKTGEPKRELDLGDMKEQFIFRVAFTADGKQLLSACGPVKLWDAHTGKELRTFDTKGLQTYKVAVSPDGQHLATGGFRKKKDETVYEILLWDAKTGEVKQTLPPWKSPSMWTSSLSFSPDGKSLAVSGTTDPDVRVKDGHKTSAELKIISLPR